MEEVQLSKCSDRLNAFRLLVDLWGTAFSDSACVLSSSRDFELRRFVLAFQSSLENTLSALSDLEVYSAHLQGLSSGRRLANHAG